MHRSRGSCYGTYESIRRLFRAFTAFRYRQLDESKYIHRYLCYDIRNKIPIIGTVVPMFAIEMAYVPKFICGPNLLMAFYYGIRMRTVALNVIHVRKMYGVGKRRLQIVMDA
jgi:hypothetical protein